MPRFVNGPESDLKSGSEIWKLNYVKSGKMAAILSKKHLISGQKYLDFEWSAFEMVGTIANT